MGVLGGVKISLTSSATNGLMLPQLLVVAAQIATATCVAN